MQTALYLTDCSVDSALWLRSWLARPIRITVVHPYALSPGEPLHKSACNPAREQAQARLTQWRVMVDDQAGSDLITKVLFGSPAETLRLHLLLNPYDYLLLNDTALADTAQTLLTSKPLATRLVTGTNPEMHSVSPRRIDSRPMKVS